METGIVELFIEWNEDNPEACGLLKRTEDQRVVPVYANKAFEALFGSRKIYYGHNILDFLENKDSLLQVFDGQGHCQTTEFIPSINRFITCRYQLIAGDLCEFWMIPEHAAEQNVLDNLPVGISRYKWDPNSKDFICIFANQAACKIHGRPEANSIGRTQDDYCDDSIFPEDQAYVSGIVKELMHSDTSIPFEHRIRRPDNEAVWIKGVISWLIPGLVTQSIYLDITESKQLELMQRRTQNLLENILATTQTAIFWKDGDRRFLGANKAFLDYYDFPSIDVILGKNDEEVGWHSDPDPYKNDELQVIHQGISTYRVHGQCLSHGENRDIVASKSPMYENGKIVGLVGSFEDVTEEYRRQAEIRELNKKLKIALQNEERASNAKSDFLARMSHDMRTPLTTVIGLCDIALEKNSDSEYQQYFREIKNSSIYLHSILNDILDMQKLTSGTITLHPSICYQQETADTVRAIIQPLADKKNIHFVTDLHCQDNPCYRCIDTTRVQQIIINLLNNAMKFTPEGGTVSWKSSVAGQTDDAVMITTVISDTGPGMTPEFQKIMYEPFSQSHDNTMASNAGSGLGLAIVKKLVDLMGGTITCHSVLGEGTTFTVALPHQIPSPDEVTDYMRSRNNERPDSILNGKHVLICEDSTINAQIIKRLLELEKIQSDWAADGAQGIQWVQSGEIHFDAILMDIRMPVMDGYEATRQIRKFNRDIPIIALSANAYPEDVAQCLSVGMNDHIAKPIDKALLFKKLAQWMEKGK